MMIITVIIIIIIMSYRVRVREMVREIREIFGAIFSALVPKLFCRFTFLQNKKRSFVPDTDTQKHRENHSRCRLIDLLHFWRVNKFI